MSTKTLFNAQKAPWASFALLPLLALAGCEGNGDAAEEAFPGQSIRWIVPTEAGGGFDRTTRRIQPYLEEALGASLEVLYRPGGNFAIGATTLLREGDDCGAVMIHGTPLLHYSHLTQNVDYTWEDFHPVASLTIDPSVIRVRNDAPWQTLDELIDDAHDRPGEIRVGIAGRTDPGHFGMREIEEATGAEFNMIFYDGGGPSRTALAGGEVSVTHTGAYNSLPVEDESRVLAVHQDQNRWPEITDDAPTIAEAIGADVEPNDFRFQVWVTQACREEHPDRYEALADAIEAAVESEEYRAALEEAGEAGTLDYIPGEEFYETVLVPRSPEFEEAARELDLR